MRNPLHVRVEEMLHAVQGVEPVAAEVFAPSADGLFSSDSGIARYRTNRVVDPEIGTPP